MEQEIWKPVVDFEGWYSVSNLGRIRRDKIVPGTWKRILKNCSDKNTGYSMVCLHKNNVAYGRFVHVLVAEAFIGPRNGFECNHKDFNKTNCSLSNLEYLTPKENTQHALKGNRRNHARGSKIGISKLIAPQVVEIREKYARGVNVHYLAKIYGVYKSTIWKIAARITWKHI